VCTAVISFKDKTVAFILHEKIFFSDLIHPVLNAVTAEMQPHWVVSKNVSELFQGSMHLLHLDRIFCLAKTTDHHFEFVSVIQKTHLFSKSLTGL